MARNTTHHGSKRVPPLRFPAFNSLWNEKTLGEMFVFKNGVNASKEQYGHGYKFINVLDIIENDFITHDRIRGAVDIDETEFLKNKVEYGDVLFQRSSETREEVGQANVYLDSKTPATFGGFVIMGKKIYDYAPMFMNYLLRTSPVRKDITSRSGGSTRYNIGQESLAKVKVILPGKEEQQKIADFMGVVDEWIEILRSQKETLAAYKKGVGQRIFSRLVRFKDEDGDEFPEWEEKHLGKILKEKKEYSTKGKGYPHISLTTKGVVPKSERYDRDFLVGNDEIKGYKITRLYDLCYNPANLKFGVITVNKLGEGIFSPIYVTFEIVGQNVDFVGYYLTRDSFVNKARKYEQGTVYERMSVHPSDFLKVKVSFPTPPEQQKIADFLTAIDAQIETKQAQITAAETWKKGLMQQLFV